MGRLDPRTLNYTEIAPPPAKSKSVQLNAIWAGPNNKLWFMDVGPNRRWLSYDTRTREFSTYNMTTKLKSGGAGGNTMRQHPNGTVWFNAIGNNTVIRLDPKTGEFTGFPVPAGVKAGRQMCDERVLPRNVASFKAFENAMTLDIAMGGSTNTVLHLLAAAHEAQVPFTMSDIDRMSRRVPVLCKVDRKSVV